VVYVGEIIDRLPARIQTIAKEYEDKEYVRKAMVVKADSFHPGERSAIHWISTLDVDRVKEVMDPVGANTKEFDQSNTVFWGHDYDKIVGSAMWTKRDRARGIKAKTRFASTPFADEKWQLVRDGHVKAWSIGFIPLKSILRGGDGWTDAINSLKERSPDFSVGDAETIILKWVLLEYSLVGVPANPNALNIAVSKGLWTNDEIVENESDEVTEVREPVVDEKNLSSDNHDACCTIELISQPKSEPQIVIPIVHEQNYKRDLESEVRDVIDRMKGRV